MFCKCSVFSLREEFFTDFQEESLHVEECKTGFPIFKKKLCEAFERVSCYKCRRFWLKTSSNNILVILEGGSPSAQIQCILNFKLFQGGCYGSGASVCVCVCVKLQINYYFMALRLEHLEEKDFFEHVRRNQATKIAVKVVEGGEKK